jgi:cyclophilin family peptidyl-prolyl cis-trans isomerase
MMTIKKYIFFILILALIISCSTNGDNRNSIILIKTTLGDITVRLYDETPVHRDNFLKLVNSGVYDGVLFHRVIKDFMIQSGDPETRTNWVKAPDDTLVSYTIPAEFRSALFHKKGALAAAREGNDINPEMRSSGTQFYIVQGKKCSDSELDQFQQQINNNLKRALFTQLLKEVTDSVKTSGSNMKEQEIQEIASLRFFDTIEKRGDYKISSEQRDVYKKIGGVPRLDGTYTLFGEVVEGLEIVDRIADSKTDDKDKPLNDVRILKMKRIRR